MPFLYDPPAGDHEIQTPVEDWQAGYMQGSHPPLVELIASIQSDPMLRGRLSRGSTATTLAVRMDAQVAMSLYEKLGLLGRTMGWLPQQ